MDSLLYNNLEVSGPYRIDVSYILLPVKSINAVLLT
jgi:hypothetical protein